MSQEEQNELCLLTNLFLLYSVDCFENEVIVIAHMYYNINLLSDAMHFFFTNVWPSFFAVDIEYAL